KTHCPQCGKLVKVQGLGVHRRQAHGYVATTPRIVYQREYRRRVSAEKHQAKTGVIVLTKGVVDRLKTESATKHYPPDPAPVSTNKARKYELKCCPNCTESLDHPNASNFCSDCGLEFGPIRIEL